MNLLAIETATEACSVALWRDGEVRERLEIAPRGHARRVLHWAEALLAEAGLARSQLDAIAVGRGPGGFTGVRLAVAIGQGLALALDRPLLGVSSLAALAQQAASAPLAERLTQARGVIAALDARMGEVYLGAFAADAAGLMRPLAAERLCPPQTVPLPEGTGWLGLGSGFGAEGGALAQRLAERLGHCERHVLPRAGEVARLAADAYARGERPAPESVAPAYLRDKVALTLAERNRTQK